MNGGPFKGSKALKPLRERLADYHRSHPLKGAVDLKAWMQEKKDRAQKYREARAKEAGK